MHHPPQLLPSARTLLPLLNHSLIPRSQATRSLFSNLGSSSTLRFKLSTSLLRILECGSNSTEQLLHRRRLCRISYRQIRIVDLVIRELHALPPPVVGDGGHVELEMVVLIVFAMVFPGSDFLEKLLHL